MTTDWAPTAGQELRDCLILLLVASADARDGRAGAEARLGFAQSQACMALEMAGVPGPESAEGESWAGALRAPVRGRLRRHLQRRRRRGGAG